jgi:glycosyltransferase involved in cell wall biosynthesis
MRICLLGIFSGNLDEGMRNISHILSNELDKNNDVLTIDLKLLFKYNFIKQIKDFKPDIIHYIPGPTIISLLLLKIITLFIHNSKTIVLATHPYFSNITKPIIRLMVPNLVLVQSLESESFFKRYGNNTIFWPCGVNLSKFNEVSISEKLSLRTKYNIPSDKFIILHIGSINKGRNIHVMEKLQKDDNQVVIVAATSNPMDIEIINSLKNINILIFTQYFPNIEELYELSDCYVFPTPPENQINAIETPLSVLEAMSCNLPVITTRYGVLPRMFIEGEGFIFINNEKELSNAVGYVKHNNLSIKNREKVLLYSWDNVIKELECIYKELLDNHEKK